MQKLKVPLMLPYIKKNVILEEISNVLDSNWLSGGPKIEEFENAIKIYNNDIDGEYISVSNATVGLEMSLISIFKRRLYTTEEVIVPSFSWVASAMSINNAGGKPVFCDVNKFGVVDVNTIEKHITKNTVAIMIVHQVGIPCDIDSINELADKYKLKIIEDAACAFGSEYKGKKIGVSKNTVVFSHQAKKCLTTGGEGGTIVVHDKKDAEWLRSYRIFGTNNTPLQREKNKDVLYDNFNFIGSNHKITDIQCAYGLAHLKYLDEEILLRSEVANKYNNSFVDDKIKPINFIPDYCTKYNWQTYRLFITYKNRNYVINRLKQEGISSKRDIQPIHREPAYNENHIDFYYTILFSSNGLQIPFYAELEEFKQNYVINTLKQIVME